MEINFFFIDDQGYNKNQSWLIRGGIFLPVKNYQSLSEDVNKLTQNFCNRIEVKWSDLFRAIDTKRGGKRIKDTKDYYYLEKKTEGEIIDFIHNFFETITKHDFKIILSLKKSPQRTEDQEKRILEFQLEDMMERAQIESQPDNLSILIHDNGSNEKEDKEIKEIYKKITKNPRQIRRFNKIIENLFIENSHMNAGIRVSDFVIGSISGALRDKQVGKKIFSTYLKDKMRKSRDGCIFGYGIKITATPDDEREEIEKEIKEKLEL